MSTVPAGRCLVVTGMHRSGTSMAAQALSRSGLYLGDTLKHATRFNPDGYFEDLDIVRFHDSLLALGGSAWHSPNGLRPRAVPESCRAGAYDLLRRKFDGHSLWGWKDPRTTLFLDFWQDILPAPKWVLVFRKPAQVAWSLLVRGELRAHSRNPAHCALIALRLWTSYGRELLRFARAHPEDSLLLRIPDDVAPANETRISHVVIDRWGYPLRPIVLSETYTPAYLKMGAPPWIEILARLHLPSRRVFDEMDELRARILRLHQGEEQAPTDTRREVARSPRSKHRVCIISPRKGAYSETFIQAHVKRLPATVKLLHGGHFPVFREDDRHLLTVVERGMSAVLEKGLHVRQARFRRTALRRYLDKEKIAVVLAEFGPTGAEVWQVCHAAGVPLIVYFHGADTSKRKWLRAYRQAYERMFASVTGLIAASRDTERRLVALGAPREKVHYNPCGADTALFVPCDPSATPPRFLFAGRFVDKKAPHLTLLAFRQVLDACPEASLTMIGDGTLLEACRQLAGALRLGEAVAFPGARSHSEVADAMRGARAVVQHSVTTSEDDVEGTPVAILEAGAAGLPVITTRHAGIADVVIHGETGFLVEEGDVDGMARHMIVVARDPALAGSVGRRARQHVVAHFSMEQSLARLWTILENAIAGPGR